MASSSSPSAPTLSSGPWKYDVFLSFRGEDTRKTFVGHLYSALKQADIYTYKDDETLPRGESIRPSLMKAIEESQIAVIIFSKNYGDSSWCLDELAHIMKCRDALGQIVMPIFYDVDPSEVRKQKRKYGEAFLKHELENKTKVEAWRKALVDASDISGWEPRNIANGDESKGIKQIVVEISQKLQLVASSANENLIGMAARMQRLRAELEVGSGGVRMIGIWGVGGGGKSTLASFAFDEISSKFDSCCFVENVREESGRYGLGKLKEKILSEMEVNKVGVNRISINIKYRRRKVLIVLDDVDHLDQLKALAGSHDWFGDGSRILITTRDKHLLTAHKVNVIHNISLLNDDEAIKLFYKHAPLATRPEKDYEHLLKEVVSYAAGLPLAITVLGSFLCDADIDEWKSALARLEEIPHDDIVGKLKISFDGLTKVEKELFLDIACFYRWEYKKDAMEILDACGFHPIIGLKVLIQRALITISEDGRFDMHDLVQEMGVHIVRGEYPNNPEKHSRVWKREDILKICAMDATTELDMIEAIRPYDGTRDPFQHLPRIVANMKNLRWIIWKGDFASPLPPSGLCFLRLDGFLQKQLWEGYKLLPNLKTMELRGLDNLIMTPDFDGLPNLERFILYGCPRIEEIHPSFGHLESLIFLSVLQCTNLKKFPPVAGLRNLEIFDFSSRLEPFMVSETQQQKMDNLHLDLDDDGNEVASSLKLSEVQEENMENLPHLDLDNSGGEVASYIGSSTRLHFFFKDLRTLNLRWCNLGDEDIGCAVWELPNLKILDLTGNMFSRLSFNRLRLPQLKWLNISWCLLLVELLELPSSIAVAIADCCVSLKSLGDISNCKWLWKVSLRGRKKPYGDILLHSMLQGNAIEDYFISINLSSQILKRFVGRLFRGRILTLRLPDDWYNDFCGFLVCVVTKNETPKITIVIKQEVGEDSLSELSQESNEAVDPEYDGTKTTVGYVSFGSLRHTTFSNSSHTVISFSERIIAGPSILVPDIYYLGVELVPRKSKDHHPQTAQVPTDSLEFYNEDGQHTFAIQHDSKSFIKILWDPYVNLF